MVRPDFPIAPPSPCSVHAIRACGVLYRSSRQRHHDPPPPPPPPPEQSYKRFFGTRVLHEERYAADFSKIINEILQPLAGTDGTQLEVRVEITATNQSGFDDSKRRIVDENAATLKFEQHGFEHD